MNKKHICSIFIWPSNSSTLCSILILLYLFIYIYISVRVAQWLKHCVSSAKVVGSIPREHILTKKKFIDWMLKYKCNSLWIKASAKCKSICLFFYKKKALYFLYMYCVRLTEACHLLLHVAALLLVLIASIVLICKLLWIKASAKWLNVNAILFCIKKLKSFCYIHVIHPCWPVFC